MTFPDTVEQRDFFETHTAYRLALIHSTCEVQTNNLISKLPKQTHQLPLPRKLGQRSKNF